MQLDAGTVGVLSLAGILVGARILAVGDGKYVGCADIAENIEKKKKPINKKPQIAVKTQNGEGLGTVCSGGFFMPALKINRNELFKIIKGVTIKEITPNHPMSMVLPVKFQK